MLNSSYKGGNRDNSSAQECLQEKLEKYLLITSHPIAPLIVLKVTMPLLSSFLAGIREFPVMISKIKSMTVTSQTKLSQIF